LARNMRMHAEEIRTLAEEKFYVSFRTYG